MRTARWLFFTMLVLTTSVCAGCNGRDEVVELFGGSTNYQMVMDSDSVVAYRVTSIENDPDAPTIAGAGILSGPIQVDPASADRLKAMLADRGTYLFDVAKPCLFQPDVALRFKRADASIDVVFCFSCDELAIFRGEEQLGREDFDARRSELVRIVRTLFPDDPWARELEAR